MICDQIVDAPQADRPKGRRKQVRVHIDYWRLTQYILYCGLNLVWCEFRRDGHGKLSLLEYRNGVYQESTETGNVPKIYARRAFLPRWRGHAEGNSLNPRRTPLAPSVL